MATKLQSLFDQLILGKIVSQPERVYGGLLHKMLRVETEQGMYAVKQLNPTIMKRTHVVEHLVYSELVARAAVQNGIPGITAIGESELVHQIGDAYFMIFPWSQAQTISAERVGVEHCVKVGKILADLHQLSSRFPLSVQEPQRDMEKIEWDSFLTDDEECRNLFESYLPQLKIWDEKAYLVSQKVQADQVISHRDLDCKNILWDADQNPIVIDWESVGWVNPMSELMEIALYWSGAEILEFDQVKFISFVESYLEAGGVLQGDLDAILDFGYRNKLEWLVYNIKRCNGMEVAEEMEIELAKHQVTETIEGLQTYERLIPLLGRLLS
ncbi:aminoglycoside phosphotransferase family protein [Gottschalkiaceae bacterium SANA]|nr:aminoglycoside phosphotransferase family protein [Gottschalkiaceae bacterium SANA]